MSARKNWRWMAEFNVQSWFAFALVSFDRKEVIAGLGCCAGDLLDSVAVPSVAYCATYADFSALRDLVVAFCPGRARQMHEEWRG